MYKPHYKHDCEKCHFVGTTTVNGDIADLFVHAYDDKTEYVIRTGDEGENYVALTDWHGRV